MLMLMMLKMLMISEASSMLNFMQCGRKYKIVLNNIKNEIIVSVHHISMIHKIQPKKIILKININDFFP